MDEATLRHTWDEFNRGGAEAVIPYIAPDVTIYPFPEWPSDPVYRGHDGVRKLTAEWTESFDEYGWDIQEVRELPGGRLLFVARQYGRTKGDGVPIDQQVSALWTTEGDLVTEMRFFLTRDEALAAAQ